MEFDADKDQHILINDLILKRIIKESELSNKDKIIEIGAGTGVLTKELVKDSKQVLAFEINKQFKSDLDKIKEKNLEIIYGNALKYPWWRYDKIISNIPYSLSEPIVMKAIQENIQFMVLTIGENFKELLESKETKVGIIASLFYKIKPIIKVEKESFQPIPRVDSWLVKFEKKKPSPIEKLLFSITKKEGKIKNAILYSLVELGKTKNQAREIIKQLDIEETILEKPVKSITGKFILLLEERLKKII